VAAGALIAGPVTTVTATAATPHSAVSQRPRPPVPWHRCLVYWPRPHIVWTPWWKPCPPWPAPPHRY
jgi:hypothetical protein